MASQDLAEGVRGAGVELGTANEGRGEFLQRLLSHVVVMGSEVGQWDPAESQSRLHPVSAMGPNSLDTTLFTRKAALGQLLHPQS